MSGRFPSKYQNFRNFLDVGHLNFVIQFYNSWKSEILKDHSINFVMSYEEIIDNKKKFNIFKNSIFHLFNNIDEKKLQFSLDKFEINKIKLEQNKSRYGSNFIYKSSKDYSDEINSTDYHYVQNYIKIHLEKDLYNFFSKKNLIENN